MNIMVLIVQNYFVVVMELVIVELEHVLVILDLVNIFSYIIIFRIIIAIINFFIFNFIEGAACKKKTCGQGNAIFGNVQSGHAEQVMCSGIGDCNWLTGKCE